MIVQVGTTRSHSTADLATSIRHSAVGFSSAAIARVASPPSTFVAGTSEYIQLASTTGKARAPCRVKSAPLGSRNQAAVVSRAFARTASGASHGLWKAR